MGLESCGARRQGTHTGRQRKSKRVPRRTSSRIERRGIVLVVTDGSKQFYVHRCKRRPKLERLRSPRPKLPLSRTGNCTHPCRTCPTLRGRLCLPAASARSSRGSCRSLAMIILFEAQKDLFRCPREKIITLLVHWEHNATVHAC